jgi:streptogramin lyase
MKTARKLRARRGSSKQNLKKQRGGQSSAASTGISIYSGGGTSRGYVNGSISVAKYNEPWGITKDSVGNMYIADKANNCIRKIDTAGNVTTFAGVQDDAANVAAKIKVPVNPGYVNGQGTAARLRRPQGIVCDRNDNLYFVETDNHVIRKISPTGLVTTFAGPPATTANSGGQTTKGFVNGSSATATFNQPFGITIDSVGNLYVADNQNHAIRKIDTNGNVTTFAGGSNGSTDGTGTAAKFKYPYAVVCDLSDNVFVADYMNGAVRKITPAGVVTTIAGGSGLGYLDGVRTAAKLRPVGITLGPNNTLFVTDGDPDKNLTATDTSAHHIRVIDIATGTVTTLAGNGTPTPGTTTAMNSTDLLNTSFNNPTCMLFDSVNKKLYVVNTGTMNPPHPNYLTPALGNYINLINLTGVTIPPPTTTTGPPTTTRAPIPSVAVTTLAGGGASGFWTGSFADGNGSAARFYRPTGVTYYNGNIYVADMANSKVRMVKPNGDVSTYVDNPLLKFPIALAFDSTGNMYIANCGNNNILKYSGSTLSLFAGSSDGTPGTAINGNGSNARFNNPNNIATDSSGNCIVSDCVNNCLRKITPDGVVSTIAEGFNSPAGVAIDSNGIIYVSSSNEHKIIKVSPNGTKSTFAGTNVGYMDGPAATAKFQYPRSIAIDSTNNMYIVDTNNYIIRKIDTSGIVTTLAGTKSVEGSDDAPTGPGLNAKFNLPFGIALDSNNNIFIGDWVNHRIRKLVPIMI